MSPSSDSWLMTEPGVLCWPLLGPYLAADLSVGDLDSSFSELSSK